MQWNARAAALAALVGIGVIAAQVGHAQEDRFSAYWGSLYKSSQSSAPPPSIRAQSSSPPSTVAVDPMHHWNQVAVDSTGLDHTPSNQGDPHVFGEQLGPGRSARAMALVHIAIFDAVNSITHRYRSFTGIPDVHESASIDAAIAQSAHDTLVELFPSQHIHCDQLLEAELNAIPNTAEKSHGINAGRRAARTVLTLAAQDGSNRPEPRVGVEYIPGTQPGEWRPDPISNLPLALGAYWGEVRPMVIQSAAAVRVPPPPALNSAAYAQAYNEAKQLGGDGVTTPTLRTDDQTLTGIYWAYDGTPSLCAPPRLYNQLVMHLADKAGVTDPTELARIMALVNVAMSDSGVAAWESKYYWKFWRPITGIRESDPGTGPSGLGDGNPLTVGDPTFTPLGAPASNLAGPDFTPPFPSYPSGHATFGGAVFQMLRNLAGTDNYPFTFVSDELNGETVDSHGVVRPLLPRSFTSFSQAEEENGQSRIYLGIHWSFDKTAGIEQGRKIANEIYSKVALPR
jgi:hypothetical protein